MCHLQIYVFHLHFLLWCHISTRVLCLNLIGSFYLRNVLYVSFLELTLIFFNGFGDLYEGLDWLDCLNGFDGCLEVGDDYDDGDFASNDGLDSDDDGDDGN